MSTISEKINSAFERTNSGTIEITKAAMDIFAKERSISFAEWLGDNYETYDKGTYWANSDEDKNPHTTAELYEQYILFQSI